MTILPFFILSHIESYTLYITNDTLNTTMKMQSDDTDSQKTTCMSKKKTKKKNTGIYESYKMKFKSHDTRLPMKLPL